MTLALLVALAAAGPLSPAEAARRLRVQPGWRVELAAAEPQVQSPVAAAFDEDGRLWVAEMHDYPSGPPPGGRPQSQVRVLEDRDGDGRFETARVFADAVPWANGILPWRGGAIVTAGAQILWLGPEGDGRREVLYDGFDTKNPQLLVSHPTLGLDGWVYVANGLRSSRVRGADGAPIDIAGMDFRFDPVRGRAEAAAGMGQFGLTFDEWGRRFVCTNRSHVIPLPIEARYLARNPFLAASALAPRPVQGAKVFPLSENKTNAASHAGTFTAASGLFAWRGTLVVAEPTGNLVHQERLEEVGGSFAHAPAHHRAELVASPDPWFRPVSFLEGPDGALYVVDMYRSEVEHPDWVPPELRARYDFDGRKDLGRIWRLVPEGARRTARRPRLSRASTAALVRLLEHETAWWRRTAHRLLVARQDPAAMAPLRRLALAARRPLGRVHASWLLEALGALSPEVVQALLAHEHPRVRETGVRLAERFLAAPTIRARVEALAGDPDARVRFQVALSLGEREDGGVIAPLARVAAAAADDPWTRIAVASAVPTRAAELLPHVRDEALAHALATVVGARRDPDAIARVLREAPPGPRRIALAGALAAGLQRRGGALADIAEAAPLLAEAVEAARDGRRPADERVPAIRLLAHAPWSLAAAALEAALAAADPEARLAAIQALGARGRREAFALLLARWPRYLPAERTEALTALARTRDGVESLLAALETGRVPTRALDPAIAQRLSQHEDARLRGRARAFLDAALPRDRRQVLARYRAALGGGGVPARGREVFARVCAGCHRVGDLGATVGPDISDVDRKPAEALLGDILDPNGAIDANYVSYTIVLKNGETLSGFIADQHVASVTLRRATGEEEVVLRENIQEIVSSGASLMPEGLENAVSVDEMRDLLAFLRGWR